MAALLGVRDRHVRRQRPERLVLFHLSRLRRVLLVALNNTLRRRHDLGHLVLDDLELALADFNCFYVVAVPFSEFVDLRSEKTVDKIFPDAIDATRDAEARTPGKTVFCTCSMHGL